MKANEKNPTTRTKSLFYKKIFCSHCLKGMKKKNERGSIKYICSSYDNFKTCKRIMVEEDYLIELIHKRFDQEVDRELIETHIESILVEDRMLFEIFIKNQESILMSKTHLRY